MGLRNAGSRQRGLTIALLLTISGLTHSCVAARITPPTGFLELKERAKPNTVTQLATTAYGGKLVVRSVVDPDEGTLDFWADTLRHDLEEARGYTHTSTTDVVDASGEPGRCLTFDVRADGLDHGYLIAVFTDSKRIRTVEFTAQSDRFAADAERVRDALQSLR